MNLYHYYDKKMGPFKNLSDCSVDEANKILDKIKNECPDSFCAKRNADYMKMRIYFEEILRKEFLKKGGIIQRAVPHYMVVEQCDWLASWYENCGFIKIPIERFDKRTISFTYGDSHPTFSDKINDGKEYRKKLYTYDEIVKVIEKYGLPQNWNSEGEYGLERYVEVHVWSDDPINEYLKNEVDNKCCTI